MPDINVKSYLDQLRQALPHVPPIPVRALKSLHKVRDYEGMVRLIRSTMNIEVRLIVGWVNSGAHSGMERAPAWVQTPVPMPYYGTAAFKATTIRVFIRKSFLEQSTYDKAAIAIAHELSHVVLDSIRHPLRREEKAVDLTAMLLGFSRLYVSASHTEERHGNTVTRRQLGYLSPPELLAASRILIPARWRAARLAGQIAKQYIALFIVGGIVLAVAGWTAIYSKWKLHQTLLTEQIEVQRQLPKRLNENTTIVSTRVGIASLTRILRVTMPPEKKVDLSAFEKNLRKGVCADRRKNIMDGISYDYEYRDASDKLIARYEIASCP